MTQKSLGAFPHTGGTRFVLWAQGHDSAAVEFDDRASHTLRPSGDGYFEADIAGVAAGTRYRYRIDGGKPVPDLASRAQPDGHDGFSEVVDLGFDWTDGAWPGVEAADQVLYELHIGSYTRQGTWAAATERLDALRDLGITVVQLMPVATFRGRHGWGYDTTLPYAPFAPYGTPQDMQRFVDRAHALGIGVILDVVYNHAGGGEYYHAYSDSFFSQRYKNDWGASFNFDGENAGPVRDFFVGNARYWIEQFHLDGLRIDAVQALFDESDEHILAEITRAVREAGGSRRTYVVVENQPQERRMVEPPSQGGIGVDAMYNDDFHHAMLVATTGRADFYYRDYFGNAQEIASALKYGFLYQGQRSNMRDKAYGTYNLETAGFHFLHFLENHDQVANSARGLRVAQLAAPARLRAITTVLLLGPQTPCLFQGQQWAPQQPFLYFAGLDGGDAEAVAKGRREGLSHFAGVQDPEMQARLADPDDPETFARSKLDWDTLQKRTEPYALHKDLIALRRNDPSLSQRAERWIDTAALSDRALLMRIATPGPAGHRLLLVNLGPDLSMAQFAQPLLAPPDGHEWTPLWSSEHPAYGGSGRRYFDTLHPWQLASDSALLLGATPRRTAEDA